MTSTWWGLDAMTGRHPDAVWATGGQKITYARLWHEVNAVRGALTEQGIGAGSVVALQVPSSFNLLWWLFALWSNGAQVLLLDDRMKPAETASVMTLIKPQFHVTSRVVPGPLTLFTDECGDISLERLNDGQPGDPGIALVTCSSGTTGTPKIVVRTGSSLLADINRQVANTGMPSSGERVYLLSPPTHGFGLATGVLQSLRAGASLVLPGRLHPDDLLLRARHADVHAILGVPVQFDLLNQAAGSDGLPSLRLALSCGDVLPEAVRRNFARRYGVPLGQVYGMTEVGAIAIDLTGSFSCQTVGRILPGIQMRIIDGELFIKTDHPPYIHIDNLDRYADGWLRTYDRAEIDAHTGGLKLLGRADSLCNIGGRKVDLTEIESVLRQHPGVTDALASCRTAGTGPGGATPVLEAHIAAACSVTSAELTAWCRDRLSDFKIPRRWHIGADIPRTSLGKVVRGARLAAQR